MGVVTFDRGESNEQESGKLDRNWDMLWFFREYLLSVLGLPSWTTGGGHRGPFDIPV